MLQSGIKASLSDYEDPHFLSILMWERGDLLFVSSFFDVIETRFSSILSLMPGGRFSWSFSLDRLLTDVMTALDSQDGVGFSLSFWLAYHDLLLGYEAAYRDLIDRLRCETYDEQSLILCIESLQVHEAYFGCVSVIGIGCDVVKLSTCLGLLNKTVPFALDVDRFDRFFLVISGLVTDLICVLPTDMSLCRDQLIGRLHQTRSFLSKVRPFDSIAFASDCLRSRLPVEDERLHLFGLLESIVDGLRLLSRCESELSVLFLPTLDILSVRFHSFFDFVVSGSLSAISFRVGVVFEWCQSSGVFGFLESFFSFFVLSNRLWVWHRLVSTLDCDLREFIFSSMLFLPRFSDARYRILGDFFWQDLLKETLLGELSFFKCWCDRFLCQIPEARLRFVVSHCSDSVYRDLLMPASDVEDFDLACRNCLRRAMYTFSSLDYPLGLVNWRESWTIEVLSFFEDWLERRSVVFVVDRLVAMPICIVLLARLVLEGVLHQRVIGRRLFSFVSVLLSFDVVLMRLFCTQFDHVLSSLSPTSLVSVVNCLQSFSKDGTVCEASLSSAVLAARHYCLVDNFEPELSFIYDVSLLSFFRGRFMYTFEMYVFPVTAFIRMACLLLGDVSFYALKSDGPFCYGVIFTSFSFSFYTVLFLGFYLFLRHLFVGNYMVC